MQTLETMPKTTFKHYQAIYNIEQLSWTCYKPNWTTKTWDWAI